MTHREKLERMARAADPGAVDGVIHHVTMPGIQTALRELVEMGEYGDIQSLDPYARDDVAGAIGQTVLDILEVEL